MNHMIFIVSDADCGIRKKMTVKIGNRKNVARYHGRYLPSPASFPSSLLLRIFSLSIRKPNTTSSQASMIFTTRMAAEILTRLIP